MFMQFKDNLIILVIFFMPPTSKMLIGHIGFGLSMSASIHLFICSSRTVHARVLKFPIWIPHGKIADTHFFFLVRVIFFSGVVPLWKNQEWNLMHAISYEPCMLGFWNFIYGFLMEKRLTCVFFSCLSYLRFLSYAPLKKSEWNLVSKIAQKVFELGAWNLVSW